jgi:hypothetical protein
MAETDSPPTIELPLLLVVLALFLMLAFQTWQLVRGHANLTALHAAQEPALDETNKFRERMDALAADTAQLADSGNGAAKQVVEALHQQGINFKPPAK